MSQHDMSRDPDMQERLSQNAAKENEMPPVTKNAFSRCYHERGENLWFTNVITGERHVLVSADGHLKEFPGIEDHPQADAEVRACFDKCRQRQRAFYDIRFEPYGEENYVAFWMIQPDGRYWEDEDGFGGTSDPEIMLYALLDRTGHYTGPYRLWKIGTQCYA